MHAVYFKMLVFFFGMHLQICTLMLLVLRFGFVVTPPLGFKSRVCSLICIFAGTCVLQIYIP